MVTLTGLLASLPPEPNEASLFAEIQQEVAGSQRKLVVIDDDPTGTQTVHDIELFTTWNEQTLAEALRNESRLFYLLTISRSMPESDAVQLNHETAQLQTVEGSIPVVINAAGYGDLAVVALGLLRADAAGKHFLYRTAVSFVRLRGAVESKREHTEADPLRLFMSVEEYLELDRTSLDARYEYVDGVVAMLACGSTNHSRISINVVSLLSAALQAACQRILS